MDPEAGTSRQPLAAALRWDLTVRLLLGVALPPLVEAAVSGSVSTLGATASLTALLVTFCSLGPDLSNWRWVAVSAVATPVAIIVGGHLATEPAGGTLWVFVLFVLQGAMLQVGVPAQLAWFPVSSAGLLAGLLVSDTTDLSAVAAGGVAGSAWAALLIFLVPLFVRAPRLDVPASAVEVDTARLARMVRSPRWTDWVLPLLLGGLAAVLLAVAAAATGGFRPYWAVFAMVSVLGPTAARTRRSAAQTVLGAMLGVGLAVVLTATPWSSAVVLATATVMLLVGALLLLVSGTLSKTLTTPLPVLMAAAVLRDEGVAALEARLVEYLVGAGVGLVVAVVAEALVRRLSARKTGAGEAPVS